LVENRDFFIPLEFDASLGDLLRNVAVPFGTEKLEWCGYRTVKKKFDDMFSRFDRIPACDRWTDRQTDVSRQHSHRYA